MCFKRTLIKLGYVVKLDRGLSCYTCRSNRILADRIPLQFFFGLAIIADSISDSVLPGHEVVY